MPPLKKMRLFIADDHAAFCDRLAGFLNGMPGIEIVGQAENALQAIQSIEKIMPDAAILDIRMPPGVGGFDVLRTIKERNLVPTVIMLTAFPSDEYRQKSMDLGAHYFFDKSGDFKKMLSVIKDLAACQRQGR